MRILARYHEQQGQRLHRKTLMSDEIVMGMGRGDLDPSEGGVRRAAQSTMQPSPPSWTSARRPDVKM